LKKEVDHGEHGEHHEEQRLAWFFLVTLMVLEANPDNFAFAPCPPYPKGISCGHVVVVQFAALK